MRFDLVAHQPDILQAGQPVVAQVLQVLREKFRPFAEQKQGDERKHDNRQQRIGAKEPPDEVVDAQPFAVEAIGVFHVAKNSPPG